MQIIKVFDELLKEATQFQEKKQDIDDFTIIVRWIGWDVRLGRKKRPFNKEPVDGPTVPFKPETDKYALPLIST